MPCFHPLSAFKTDSGSIVFRESGKIKQKLTLPCGQCVGCRLERSRQWAVRCMHESQMHEKNCFITLTFSSESLAARDVPMSLDVRDFQLFMKRLRKKYGEGIRFYHCGEYGEMCAVCFENRYQCKCQVFTEWTGRPHYHACLFGHDFDDKELWKIHNGEKYYVSKELSELWPYGWHTIGEVTFESAAYCARYIMKKINGDLAESRYYDLLTGECLKPEYTTMSRRPGIGRAWLDKYHDDVYPHDTVVVRGTKCRPPKYYDFIKKDLDPESFEKIQHDRLTAMAVHADNNTPERLSVRESITKARLKLLKRNSED